MADQPSPTTRKNCVHLTAGTIQVSSIIEVGETSAKVSFTPIQCMGPACQYWLHDADMPPDTGDCGVPLGALFGATGAKQLQGMGSVLAEMNQNIANLGLLVQTVATKLNLLEAKVG